MKRVVVKLGSNVLSNGEGLHEQRFAYLAEAVAALAQRPGYQVILVSSGAVAAGFSALGFSERPSRVDAKQASAAVGQAHLMKVWNESFQKHGIPTAQFLLTRHDFADRIRFLNALSTFEVVLKGGAIPVVNENDTVSVEEIAFGDNDMLAALVGGLLHASLVVLLSDVPAVYSSDPRENEDAVRYDKLPTVPEELITTSEVSLEKKPTALGTGGMAAKLRAARHAVSLGIPVYIGSGCLDASQPGMLTSIVDGAADGTYIGEGNDRVSRRKQWLSFHAKASGDLIIDDGATEAILVGKRSLLPAGVVRVDGEFGSGEVVRVLNRKGICIGRGLVTCSSEEMRRVSGMSSAQAGATLGVELSEVVHRDDWVAFYNEREWNDQRAETTS